jgi:hypothetical protein
MVPFNGRCLVPLPVSEKPAFKKGIRVVWAGDQEEGTLLEATPDTLVVRWDETGYAVYARCSLAARETIVAIKSEEAWV